MAHPFNPSPPLRRQRQADICEFQGSLVYKVYPKTAMATQKCYLKNQNNKRMFPRGICAKGSAFVSGNNVKGQILREPEGMVPERSQGTTLFLLFPDL